MIKAAGLSNEVIGGKNAIKGGIRFQAKYSSPLASLRCYDIDHAPGYAGGTGGSILMQLFGEVNGLPGGPPLATGVRVMDEQFSDPTTGRGRFPLICFDKQIPLIKGVWYWIVISDADPTPTVDYYSMDYLIDTVNVNQVPECSIWIWFGQWKLIPYLVPSPLVFHYSNGLCQGLGWIAAPNGILEAGSGYGFPVGSCV
jgi:hypothetical protein